MNAPFEAEIAIRGRGRTHLLPRARPGDCQSARARIEFLRAAGEVSLKDAIAADGVLAAIEGMPKSGEAPDNEGESQ